MVSGRLVPARATQEKMGHQPWPWPTILIDPAPRTARFSIYLLSALPLQVRPSTNICAEHTPLRQMGKAARHKCTSLFCLGVVLVPLVVFGLSAFFAVWLWWLEGDIAGCFKPGGDKIPPSPTPSPGTGGRQLAIGGSTAGGTVVDHTNTTSSATGDERPICSYYEWCARPHNNPPPAKTTHLLDDPVLCAQD